MMKMKSLFKTVILAWLLCPALLLAGGGKPPQLASVFTSHMVLQRDMPVPVWGTAKPGAEVEVAFAGQKKTATAGPNGKWSVTLEPLSASDKPGELVVSEAGSPEKTVISDVLVGEVWVGSGDRGMQSTATDLQAWANPKPTKATKVPFKQSPAHIKVEKLVATDLAAADGQPIRFLMQGQVGVLRQHPELRGWQVCSSSNAQHQSFIGYCFAREVARELKVPVGFITAAEYGSRIDGWISREAFESDEYFKGPPPVPEIKHGYQPAGSWYVPEIQPLVPLAIRGVIWYQGERDVFFRSDPLAYYKKQELLIRSWRKAWGREDLPFYGGQFSSCYYYENLPNFQEGQRRALSSAHTGLIVTSDLTDNATGQIPVNKWEIARRFWLWAARDAYGKKEIVASGPAFKGMEVRDGKAILHFDHCGSGLTTCDNQPLRYFQICDHNGAYWPAQAAIEGDTVVVSHPEVKQPLAVRYAWHRIAPLTLYNKEGLPASSFCSEPSFPERPPRMAAELPEAGIVRSPIPDKTVVLTFDDACLSQFTFAAPVMKKYGFGGTFFVCEYPVRPGQKREDYYMNWEQIKQLNDMGFEIGNHSMTHPDSLASLPHEQIVQEIAAVEELCAKNGIPKPVTFAHPNYSCSQDVMDILRERGYLWGRSGGALYDPTKDHPFLLSCVILPKRPAEKTAKSLRECIAQAKDGKALLLLFHGIPDRPHPWVTFDPENFENCMKILKESGCTVVALRDLSKYIDSKRAMDLFQPIWRDFNHEIGIQTVKKEK